MSTMCFLLLSSVFFPFASHFELYPEFRSRRGVRVLKNFEELLIRESVAQDDYYREKYLLEEVKTRHSGERGSQKELGQWVNMMQTPIPFQPHQYPQHTVV